LYSTGIAPWNSPQFVVASRFKNPSPRSLEDSCLVSSPFAFALASPSGLRFRTANPFLSKEIQALRSLLAHLPRLSPASPAKIPVLVRPKPGLSAPRLSLRSLQRQSDPKTLLLTLASVQKTLAGLLEVPSSGFGYPLEVLRLRILGSLFQLPTLLGFSLQSFPPPVDPEKGFPSPVSSLRFPSTPSRC